MANPSRTDASSLSFGRRLINAERDAADAKRELADLKQALPNSRELESAALAGDAIKAQRKAAKQMMGRSDATLSELSSIDPSVLTPQYQEQLRLSKRDAAYRELPMQNSGFTFATPQAQIRFQNWTSAGNALDLEQQSLTDNNLTPEPQTPFQKWAARQDSPQGQAWRNKQHQSMQQQQLVQRQREFEQQNLTQPKGQHIGKIRSMDSAS